MEKLTQLIGTLTSREIRSIRKYYGLKESSRNSDRFKLFELILDKPAISDGDAAAFFGKDPSDTAFSMLKRRLKDDVVKVAVWEYRYSDFQSPVFKARFECRLLIAESELLNNRGAHEMAIECLTKAKKLAEKYELTNEAIIINDQLIQKVAIRKGYTTYAELANRSLAFFDTIKHKFLAQDYLRQLTIPNLFVTNKEASYIEKATEANRQLQRLSTENDSVEIRFWYLRSEVFFNHLKKDYKSAQHFSREFLDLVEKSPVVYSQDNIGGANMQLAMISIFLGQFATACEHAGQASVYFRKDSLNDASARDTLFTALFYNNELEEATAILDGLFKIKAAKKNSFLQSKWKFYRAQLLFAQKDFEACLAMLQEQSDLFSDKSGWRLGIKILEMMCIVELGNDDWLDYRMETFRKLLADLKNEKIARAKKIYQLFRAYIRHAYDWSLAIDEIPEHFELLSKGEDDHFWDPMGYEMHRFDRWLEARIKKPERAY